MCVYIHTYIYICNAYTYINDIYVRIYIHTHRGTQTRKRGAATAARKGRTGR